MAKERDYTNALFIVQYSNYKIAMIEKDCAACNRSERLSKVYEITWKIQNGFLTIDEGMRLLSEV